MSTGVNAPMHTKNHGKEMLFSIIIIVVTFGAGYMIYQQAGGQDLQPTQATDTSAYSNYQDQTTQETDINYTDTSSPDSTDQTPPPQQQGNY